jgi:glycosyltransferase involved in cell wall biosynthesis
VYAFLDDKMIEKIKSFDKYIDKYVSVSNNATKYAIEKLGLDESKIVTIPNGLIIEEHEERLRNSTKINRSDFGLKDDDYVFLNVASYNLHKGHYLMADAMKKIIQKRGDIKILCIGNVIMESHFEQFSEYLKKNNLQNNILMPGHFTNIEAFYDICDAFLLPSFIEGWSIAMNEAMFYEKPVILSDTGGSNQVIENNDIGILLKNEYGAITNLDCKLLDHLAYDTRNFSTSDELASSMIKFADNSEFWKMCGKKGKEKILNLYNFNNVVSKYEDIIIKIAKK